MNRLSEKSFDKFSIKKSVADSESGRVTNASSHNQRVEGDMPNQNKRFYRTGGGTGFYRPDHVPTDEELTRLVLRK